MSCPIMIIPDFSPEQTAVWEGFPMPVRKLLPRTSNPAVMREGVVVQMTWPGAPTVYYGDEAGVCGFTDPDNRRTYPWGHEDQADDCVPQR